MGLMNTPAAAGLLVITPHPVLVDGQRQQPADLRPGESLYAFLMRHVDSLDGQPWQVSIGGKIVPRHLWHHVFPKHGQVIELRGAVGKAAIAIVAMVALTYFTFGLGAATAGMWGAGAVAGSYGAIAATAVYMAGSVLINRVLQPKMPKAGPAAPTSYSLAAGRNRARPYEPLGLLLGSMRIAPDLASMPYTYYEGDEQFLAMVLTPGLNVDSVEALYNGDALLSSYEGVQVWHNGFPGMSSQSIPLYSNADVVDGGTLLDTNNEPKNRPGAWVQRASSAGTVRLMVGIEFQIYDKTSKGKDKLNQEQIQIQYRAAGATAWQAFGTYNVRGTTSKTQRASYSLDVPEGQYDVRVRVAGQNTDGSGAQASFTWTTLTSVQRDTASYAGIPRIGIRMQANGQLNGTPDELRCVAHSLPIPVWKGDALGWVTERTSNPGAQILAFARGIYARDVLAPGGRALIAGMALPDRQIDIEGLKAFMLHCAANDFTYDNWITDVRSSQQVLDAVALAGLGQISWPRGRLSVVWAADDQPLSGVVNMATIKKGQFQVDYTLANAADGIEYTYLDTTTWEARTLRVPAPGVTTMLNPAQVTGEGITSEAHAALMARYHLAQSLFQYKAISYSTDIEHLSYARMSVLALQHDMTQWGFGGRVAGAALVGGRMTLTLDEPVPAPAQGNAFVGVRIPGERVYRVLKVQPFTGTSNTLTLADDWPSDAAVPGNSEANPAWDSLWIYDFKQTPGLRVRVTGIRPESDLKGAAVEVVAESPEFWHYVRTGEYIRPPNDSRLDTRPVASGLKVTERQVVQGDTEFTELQATWEVSGPVGDTVVLTSLDGNGELEQVARTVTRSASWRIPAAGTYPVTVRPYGTSGNAGVAASLIYTTRGADAAPVLVDLFDVEQLSGGVRRYTWGFFADTIQSANFAGVEIRYIAGNVAQPNWDAMTPVGDDGYHASAFEAVLPPAGDWTFACRSRNTSGTLSAGMQVVFKRLPANLGEVIDTIEETVEDQTRKQVEQQQQIDKDRADSIARDAAEAAQRAADYARAQADLVNETALRTEAVKQVADNLSTEVTARREAVSGVASDLVAESNARKDAVKGVADDLTAESAARKVAVKAVADQATAVAEAVSDEEAARIEAQLNAKLEWQAEISVERTQRQAQGDSLAQQISMVAAGSGTQFDSKRIWYFDTTTESWTGNGTLTVVDGMLRPANGTSSYAQTPANLALDGNSYRFIKTRVKRVGAAPWRGLIRWTTDADLTWDDAKSITVPEPSFDANGLATVDIDLIPWGNPSPIRAVRFALVTIQTAAAYLLYDYVAIGRPTPGASVAMVQDVATALTNADSAEATARNDLAVQMRGQYNGNDLAGVTSGFIAQERNARVTADTAIAQRTSVIEARMPSGTGALATSATVTANEQASVSRDNAIGTRVGLVEARMPAGNGALATAAQVVDEQTARVEADNAAATNLTALKATITVGENLIPDPSMSTRNNVTIEGGVPVQTTTAQYASATNRFDVAPGDVFDISIQLRANVAVSTMQVSIRFDGPNASNVTRASQSVVGPAVGEWITVKFTVTVPDAVNTAYLQIYRNPAGSVSHRLAYIARRTPMDINNAASIVANEQASVSRDNALAGRTTVIEARMPAGTGALAAEATVTANEQASVARDAANATAISSVQASLPALAVQGSNLVTNGGWEMGADAGWTYGGNSAAHAVVPEGRSGNCWRADGSTQNNYAYVNGSGAVIPVTFGKTYRISCWYRTSPDYNGTSGNGKLRVANQSNALLNGPVFASNRPDWTQISFNFSPAASVTGLRVWVGADNTAGTLWVDDVAIEEVTELLANAEATSALGTKVTSLEGTVAATSTAVTQLRTDVDSKASAQALQALDTKVTQQGQTLTSQAGQLTNLQSGVATAQQAAEAAAAAAGAKGKVLFQSATPAAADRLPQNLWIDTTGGANTPKRWSGSAWVTATDKVATDAAAAAAAAQAAANANAAAISTMDTRVTAQEGKVESLATSVTNLASNARALAAQGGNMVLNGGWEEDTDSGWTYSSLLGVTFPMEGRTGKCLRVTEPNGNRTANANGTTNVNIAVTSGKKYRVRGYYKTDAAYNGTNDNGKIRIADQDGNLIAGLGFVSNRPDWTLLETVVSVTSISALRLAINTNHRAGSLWVDDVSIDEVTDVLANADATSALGVRVTSAEGKIESQGQSIVQVSAAAGAADAKAATAQAAADAAATAAGNKGKVLFQSATPAAADRLSQNLWIDTTNNANTPKRWNNGAWVTATDKAATDAAAAAAAAQTTANQAKSTADATATGLTALTGTVTQQGTAITANGNAITSVGARVGGLESRGQNLITDAGFEGRNVNQGVGNGYVTDVAARTGTRSLAVRANGTIRDVSLQQFDSAPDRVYYGECWVRNAPGDPIVGGQIQLGATYRLIGGGNSYGTFVSRSATQLTDGWVKISGYVTTPANCQALLIRPSVRGESTAGLALFDDLYVVDVTEAYNAQQAADAAAQATSTLGGRVTAAEGKVEAQGQAITQVTASVGTAQTVADQAKAAAATNASAISGLTATTAQQGNTLTAQGNQLTQLRQDVDGKATSTQMTALTGRVSVAEGKIDTQASALTRVEAGLGSLGGDNLLGNSSFETPSGTNAAGWSNSSSGTNNSSISRSFVDSVLPNSNKAWRWDITNLPAASYYEMVGNANVQTPKVEVGKRMVLSGYVRGTPGVRVFLQVGWINAAGGAISYSGSPASEGIVTTEAWGRKQWVTAPAPAGAVSARVYFRIYGSNTADQWVEWDNAQLQVGEVATGYAPSLSEVKNDVAANATATTDLTTRTTSIEGQLISQGSALTGVTARLTGMLTRGENLIPNSNFAQEMSDWNYNNGGGSANSGTWGATSGDGGPGFVLTKAATQNPYLTSNNLQWQFVQPLRRYRVKLRAKALSGAGTLLARLQRRNADGGTASMDTQMTFGTTAFEYREFDYPVTFSTTSEIRLQVFAYPSNTSVAIDRVELYDVTDQLAAEANAAATSSLTGRVSTAEGRIDSQATAITQVTAAASTAEGKASAAQAAADAAATAAGNKGKVLFQSATPAAADRLPQNLWIDTTNNANTPKRWNNSAWVAATDKAATDAAAAAAAAQTTANQAKGTADATASGLTATNARVTAAEGSISAQSNQINQVQASLGEKANASALMELDARVSNSNTGGNLLYNTTFDFWKRTGWGWGDNQGFIELGDPTGDGNWNPQGTFGLGSYRGGVMGASQIAWFGTEYDITVEAGKRYCMSAYVAIHRCNIRLEGNFYNQAGQLILQHTSEWSSAQGRNGKDGLGTLERPCAFAVAPTGATYFRYRVLVVGRGEENPYFWIFRPMFSVVDASATAPPPWSAGGQEAKASWMVNLDVNGNVAGLSLAANGATSEFKVLANAFRLLAPGGADGMEIQDGYLRVWAGNSQRIIGNNIGPDGLMDYFGPNVGAAAATKANATVWMDRNGNAYFGGSLSAGVYKNANRTTSTVPLASVEVGPFATMGKQRVVVASFNTTSPQYENYFNGRAESNPPPPVVPNANSRSTLRLRRNPGSGVWSDVASQTYQLNVIPAGDFYMDRDSNHPQLPNGGWIQRFRWSCSGSFTSTEPGANVPNYMYEAALTQQALGAIQSQTVSVVCTEEP